MSDPMHARFRETLPRFVNGTVAESERVFMIEYLESNPTAQAELRFEKALQETVRRATERRPEDAGLSRLLHEWQTEKAHARTTQAPSLGERLRRWREEWGLSPAFALAATIAVVQAGIMAFPDRASDAPVYRGSVAEGEAGVTLLQLTPKPDITYAALVEVMRKENVLIVAGPDASGVLKGAVPAGLDTGEASRRLMDSGLFDDIATLPASR